MAENYDLPPIRQSLLRLGAVFLLVGIVSLGASWAMAWLWEVERSPTLMGGILILALLVYALFIALPFVPGVEIGISLIVMHGYRIVPYVYLATVLGLVVAFLAGRYLSYRWLHQLFLDLRMRRAGRWLKSIHRLSPTERVDALRQRFGTGWARYLVDYRLIALAVLLNVPGSSLIGGGGGISMLAGLSRLYSTPATIATIAVAVSPVPLTAWLLGIDFLGQH